MRKLLLLMLVPATALAGCAARPGQGRSPDAIGMKELTFTTDARTIPAGTDSSA